MDVDGFAKRLARVLVAAEPAKDRAEVDEAVRGEVRSRTEAPARALENATVQCLGGSLNSQGNTSTWAWIEKTRLASNLSVYSL